jgi:hypothetical protein
MSDGNGFGKMTRDELNNVAGERGIADAASYPNKAELIAAIEAAPEPDAAPDGDADSDTGDDAGSEDEPESAPEKTGQRYQVLKAVTDEDGRTYMPGDEFVPGAGFPSRRPKQLVDQKFLRPLD